MATSSPSAIRRCCRLGVTSRLGVPDRFAQLQGGIQQGRNVEYHFVLGDRQFGDPRSGDERCRYVDLIAPLRSGPGAHPSVAESTVQRAPPQVSRSRLRRIATPLTLCDSD